jgi:phosphoglycerate dehydrogenase-like enzyme
MNDPHDGTGRPSLPDGEARNTGTGVCLLAPAQVPPDTVESVRRAFPGIRVRRLSSDQESSSARLAMRVRRSLGPAPAPAVRGLCVDGAPLEGSLPGVHVLLATPELTAPMVRVLVPALPDLRWIHSTMTGIDRFAGLGLPERGVVVSSPRGVHARRVAEFVMGIVYADAKRVPERWDGSRAGRPAFQGSFELPDLAVGVIGFGAIGREVARLARANGMRVVAWVLDEASAPRIDGVEVTARLDAVLAVANVAVLALPLTAGTRHLVGARELALLPQDAVVVNVGRGATLVERDLYTALEFGRLRRAWLDVVEGHLPVRHPLTRSGRIVLTAHSASESRRTSGDLLRDFLANLEHFLRAEPPPGWIDVERGY